MNSDSSEDELDIIQKIRSIHNKDNTSETNDTSVSTSRFSIFAKRKEQGAYNNLIREMKLYDPESYHNYMRMSKELFNLLLSKVGPKLSSGKRSRHDYEPISAGERLALTIRYLASGDSQTSMSYSFRINKKSVNEIVHSTSNAIWEALVDEYVKAPSTKEDWLSISKEFEEQWNFPNCIGAIDGKHIRIQAPINSGSEYFNYKGFHSIVLLGICDANYRFIIVDIGEKGRHSDGGVLSHSLFGRSLMDGALDLPAPKELPNTNIKVPHVLLGDEAFPLRSNLMRPYPGKDLNEGQSVFNYRLSRARRVVENAFGILATRWRIFRGENIGSSDRVIKYSKATIAMHNFLQTNSKEKYNTTNEKNTLHWTQFPEEVDDITENEIERSASEIRNEFKCYFNSPNGKTIFQDNIVSRK